MTEAPVERTSAGEIRLRLGSEERDLLRRLCADLEAMLATEPEHPSLARLSPPAYEEDEGAESEFRALTGEDLEAQRLANLRTLGETVDGQTLTEEQLEVWLIALNDLRLVLGTQLGVSEDFGAEGFDPGHPQAYELAVYAFLTWVQDGAVAAAL